MIEGQGKDIRIESRAMSIATIYADYSIENTKNTPRTLSPSAGTLELR
jgi:hypothetical protein